MRAHLRSHSGGDKSRMVNEMTQGPAEVSHVCLKLGEVG